MVAEKESKKRYAVQWNGHARSFPSMGLAVAFARRVPIAQRNDSLQIDVEHFIPSGMDRGWYPWAKYNVGDDGSYERVG